MLTYLEILNAKESYDIEEFTIKMIIIPISIIADILFIFFQPVFIIAYYFYKKNRK